MATDTQAILDAAEKVGQMVKDHPSYERYKSAAKSVAEDPEAGRLVADFNRQLETLLRQEQSGMPVSDAQHAQLESLQQRIA
ncbi:MAG: YlbF family regulator, partial [Phycisphaerae bacterium]